MPAELEGLEDDEPLPVRTGELVGGKYTVESILGVGGMAIVCSAIHKDLGQEVALKIMRSARKSQESVDRFLLEARAAVRLKSLHVCKVLDVGTLDNGLPYMVMERLDGDDLENVLDKRGVMTVPEAVDFVLQACDAISEAHLAGIIHRDLKPSNLFVTRQRSGKPLVKVLDFGISKLTFLDPDADEAMKRVVTQETVVLGSPSYMSPEQIRGQKDVDARTDVWSLGAILYELLTGKEPFGADDPKKVFARVITEQPPPIEVQRIDMPAGLSDVVMQALTKDRDKRFDDVDAFATALARFAGKPSNSQAPGWRDAIQVEVDLDSMVLKRAAAAETFVLPERRSGRGKTIFALTLFALLVGGGVFYGVKSGRFARLAAAAPDPPPPAASAPVASAAPPASTAAPVVAVVDTPSSATPPVPTSAPRGRRVPRARGVVTAPPEDTTAVAAAPPPASAQKPTAAPAAPETSSKYHRTDW